MVYEIIKNYIDFQNMFAKKELSVYIERKEYSKTKFNS